MSAAEPRSYLYTGDSDEQVPPDVSHVRVDASVTIIPNDAFKELWHLVEVELPEGLLEIGSHAFYGCESLVHVNFPSTLKTIGDNAFACNLPCRLEDIYYQSTGVKIVEAILPNGLIEIGANAFLCCQQLKRVCVPSSLTSIGSGIFMLCTELEHVQLCEGLEEIPAQMFNHCMSLQRITIPSSVKRVADYAFCYCRGLVELNLPEGLERIEFYVALNCNYLKRVKLPSTVRSIEQEAFNRCYELEVDIPDSVRTIGLYAFRYTHVVNYRMPPLLKKFDWDMIDSMTVFSVELPNTLKELLFRHIRPRSVSDWGCSLRNIAIPRNCTYWVCSMEKKQCDLCRAFPSSSSQGIGLALAQRFDGLKIHELCYYQSYQSTGVLMRDFNRLVNPIRTLRSDSNSPGNQQDCLGMTPLHILACSAKPNLELCRVLIQKYPENLLVEDKWGDIPLLYALWSNASMEMVQLLANNYKTLFPAHDLNWRGMVVTLGKRRAPITCMKSLFNAHQTLCNSRLDLQEVIAELIMSELPLKRTMKILLEYDIDSRLELLAVNHWGGLIKGLVKECFLEDVEFFPSSNIVKKFNAENVTAVYSSLTHHEQLKDSMALLELALWKKAIASERSGKVCERETKKARVASSVAREQCRITCGADIIVPNVLAYLSPSSEYYTVQLDSAVMFQLQ